MLKLRADKDRNTVNYSNKLGLLFDKSFQPVIYKKIKYKAVNYLIFKTKLTTK